MNISSIDKDIREILKSNYYQIPRFQRPYSWEREHIEDFWNDAIIDCDSDYFIGSMVVFRISDDTFGIVDGQQRLTTITMLLSSIRENFKSTGEHSLAKGTQGMIERKDLNYELRYILQTETSYPFFHENVQKYEESDFKQDELKHEDKNIQKGYEIINEKIKTELDSIQLSTTISEDEKQHKKKEKLIELRDKILNLKVIYIDLDNEDDAYIIFETLNTRGKDLRVSDLVKNHLTKLLPRKNIGVDISKDKWTLARGLVEGSTTDLNMDSFLHHFWLSKNEFTTQKKLFKLIKKVIKKNNANQFLNEIYNESKIYRGFLEKGYRKWTKQEVELCNSFEAMNLFRVKQPIPMLLSIMREYEKGELKLKHVKDIIKTIEYFHFIFTAITSQRSSGGISFMYAYHARELLNSTSEEKLNSLSRFKVKLRDKLPSKEEFIINFFELLFTSTFTKQKKLVQYILRKYDDYYSKKVNTGISKDYEQMTIEHIHPENASDTSMDQYYVGMIGNLLLVNHKLNEKLGNKHFAKKKAIYLTSQIFLDEKIMKATSWDKKKILERTEYIGEGLYNEVFKF